MKFYVPDPSPEAVDAAVGRLRENQEFRAHVAATEDHYINASVLLESGAVQIHMVPVELLRDALRIIKAEEAASAAAKSIEGEELPCFMDGPGPYCLPDTICARTR